METFLLNNILMGFFLDPPKKKKKKKKEKGQFTQLLNFLISLESSSSADRHPTVTD
jgi:hypothetical protein